MWYPLFASFFWLAFVGAKEPQVTDFTDLVQHRYAFLKLPDKTSIQYWFGQMTINNADGNHYLQFNDAVTNGYFLESEPFEVNIGDSLFFRRLIVFSNPAKSQAKGGGQVVPDSVVFNSRSRVRFVVEIEHLANQRKRALDTVTCFTNARGEMRFRQGEFDSPFVRRDISMQAGNSRLLVRLDTSDIGAPLMLEEMRHLDQQTAMNPYETSLFSHQISANGFDVDSLMEPYRTDPPPAKP